MRRGRAEEQETRKCCLEQSRGRSRARPDLSHHPSTTKAFPPPLLLNHLLFEGEFCFIIKGGKKKSFIWVICPEVRQ